MIEIFEIFLVLKEREAAVANLEWRRKADASHRQGFGSQLNLVMLDEPPLGLAPILVDSIHERLQILMKRDFTVLLVEQNTNNALKFSDRGYALENGRIVMEGSGEELSQSEHVKKHYLGL